MSYSLRTYTVWKVSKCEVFSGPYFSAFGLNTGKYVPEKIFGIEKIRTRKNPYLDTFHAVLYLVNGIQCFSKILRFRCLTEFWLRLSHPLTLDDQYFFKLCKDHLINVRSSRPEVLLKTGIIKNFAEFTGKHLWQSLFFKNVAGLRLRLY